MTPCRRPLALLVVLLAFAPPAGVAAGEALPPSLIDVIGEATIAAVETDGSLRFDDGTTARLAGIELPRPPLADRDAPWPAAENARAALAELADGRKVTLYRSGRSADRYGRRQVQAVTEDGLWLQGEMLRRGWARVASTPDGRIAARDMLGAEATARDAGLGMWALAEYRVRRAAEAVRLVDSIQLVEDRVSFAERRKSGLWLRLGSGFGRRLTVHLPPPVVGMAVADPVLGPATADPHRLIGARLRVRGWIGQDRYPVIEASHPEQIEMVDNNGGNRRRMNRRMWR